MPIDAFFAMFGILAVAAWTPGPNNAMLSASGASFGFRATLPHMAGVAFGFPLMLFACAMGLGQVVASADLLREAMRWLGVALLLWVAFKIATAPLPAPLSARGAATSSGRR
ncbi:MAG: LysE family transporter [Paracoccaceae bacterium]